MLRIRLDLGFADTEGAAHLEHPLFSLLAAIRREGSIRVAATSLDLSYRHVWGECKRWEAHLGRPLIVWEKGRAARLTDFGARLSWAAERARARAAPLAQGLAAELDSAFALAFDQDAHVLPVVASHDLLLPVFRDALAARAVHLDLQYRGSLDALAALSAGHCLLAGIHVGDDHGRGTFAERAFKPHLKPGRHKLIEFARRRQGLMAAPGNPQGITGIADLARADLVFVNRQKGSGTRVEIEALLAAAGIANAAVRGFDTEETTHLAVAAAVASGAADVGCGIEAAAARYGLAFVPLTGETYFLACLKETLDHPAVARLIETLQGPAWRAQAGTIPGYTFDKPGTVVSLTRTLPWYRLRARSRAG